MGALFAFPMLQRI